MSKTNRRRMLKGLALSVPAAWTAPLVKSVVLPAHAQTSGCAPEGCYLVGTSSAAEAGTHFYWPGGTGPETVFGRNFECDPDSVDTRAPSLTIVATTTVEEAISLLDCSDGFAVTTFDTTPALSGCYFFTCLPE